METPKVNVTHIVVVLPPTREVLFPFGLVQRSLRGVSKRSTKEMYDKSPRMVFLSLKGHQYDSARIKTTPDAPSGFSHTLSLVPVLNQ